MSYQKIQGLIYTQKIIDIVRVLIKDQETDILNILKVGLY